MGGEASRANGLLGGRPKGAPDKMLSRRARARANDLARDAKTPLDILLDNMLYWHRHVESMQKQIETLVVNIEDQAQIKDALLLFKNYMEARLKSQACAVDAAPYCHARLQSISVSNEGDNNINILGGLPPPAEEPIPVVATPSKEKAPA